MEHDPDRGTSRSATSLTRDEIFFYDHAGWGHFPDRETPEQGRLRSAGDYAAAEALAREAGWRCVWEPDDIPWDGDGPEPMDVAGPFLVACIDAAGRTLASVGGVWGGRCGERRVMEAELFMEACS